MNKETKKAILYHADLICLIILHFFSFFFMSLLFSFVGFGVFWALKLHDPVFNIYVIIFISIFIPVAIITPINLDIDKDLLKLNKRYKK